MRPISLFVTAIVFLSAPAAFAATKEISLQDKQQAACYDDVNKLCKDALPDVDKVTACMKDKKPLVSAKCAAMWDAK